jgi:uncharacterized protein (DUF58 family)
MEIIALLVIVYAALLMQGKLFREFVFKKLDYRCEFSVPEAHEGDEIFLVETVHNRKPIPVPWLKVEIYSSRWLYFANTTSVVTQESRYVTSNFVLKGYQRTIRRWKLKCLKRGVFTTENVSLVSGDLVGLSTDSIAVNVNAQLVVYPQVINLEDLFVPANYLQGDTIVKRWIIDDPFIVSGAREYTPRDPLNRVDWHATARTGNLMVKKNDYTSQFSYTIALNIQSIENEYQGTVDRDIIELGIKVATTILDRALRAGIPVRLATNGTTIDGDGQMIFTGEASGADHVRELMKILARLELKCIRDYEIFLEGICDSVNNSDVILITPYVTENIYELVRRLKARRNRVSIIALNLVEARKIPRDIDIYTLSGVEREHAGAS